MKPEQPEGLALTAEHVNRVLDVGRLLSSVLTEEERADLADLLAELREGDAPFSYAFRGSESDENPHPAGFAFGE